MPSPFGHALAGLAISWSRRGPSDPGGDPKTVALHASRLTLLCVALATIPDLDLLVPGAHRTVTHSVGAVALVTIVAIVVTGWVTRRIDWRVTLLCTAAYGSHVVLDWFGRDPFAPFGIQALWPFSHRWFISPWPIFPVTERRQFFTTAAVITNIKAVAVELLVLGPVVAVLGWRRAKRAGGAGRSTRT